MKSPPSNEKGDSCAADPRQGYDLPPHSCFPTNVTDTVWCFEHPNTTILDCLTEKDRRIEELEREKITMAAQMGVALLDREELQDSLEERTGEAIAFKDERDEARKALRRMLYVAKTHGCKGEGCCDWTVVARRVLKGEGK